MRKKRQASVCQRGDSLRLRPEPKVVGLLKDVSAPQGVRLHAPNPSRGRGISQRHQPFHSGLDDISRIPRPQGFGQYVLNAHHLKDRPHAAPCNHPGPWSSGLERSYLKLRCIQKKSGKMQKQFSTMEHFSGLRVTHGLAGQEIELTVVWDVVQARLMEIRALSKEECKELSPVVTTATETFRFPAKSGLDESVPFGENIVFRVTAQALGGEAVTDTSDTDAP